MAITCSWEKPLGICYHKYDEERKNPLIIWGGGNCLAVITTGKGRVLQCFFFDKEHFKKHKFEGNEFLDITLYAARKKDCKILMQCFYEAGFSFKVTQGELIVHPTEETII